MTTNLNNNQETTKTTDNTISTFKPKTNLIVKNTKIMERDFIENNLDLNKEFISGCTDVNGNATNFISSHTQEYIINKVFAEVTRSVMNSPFYDDTDTSIAKAKRIYSRKKEIIRNLITLFDNGGYVVKFYKYVTRSGNVYAKTVEHKDVRKFISQLHHAVKDAEIVVVDGVQMLKLPEQFLNTMVKLGIYENVDVLRPLFIEKKVERKQKDI